MRKKLSLAVISGILISISLGGCSLRFSGPSMGVETARHVISLETAQVESTAEHYTIPEEDPLEEIPLE